jgi:2-haloacid dehalogenase
MHTESHTGHADSSFREAVPAVHRRPMNRRTFVAAVATGAASACIRRTPPRDRGIRAVAFDLFTIFDPRSIDAAVVAELPEDGAKLAQLWKLRAFEYCWLRASADRYLAFDRIMDDALSHALAAHGREVEPAVRRRLLGAWTELSPWPDSERALVQMRESGLALAPLANFAPAMIETLLARTKLRPLFSGVFSTDAARSYKPARRAYQLGVDGFRLPASAIAFSAFGGWDAVGATWFGYPTFWVNRLGVAGEQLSVTPAGTGADLVALGRWVAGHNAVPEAHGDS